MRALDLALASDCINKPLEFSGGNGYYIAPFPGLTPRKAYGRSFITS